MKLYIYTLLILFLSSCEKNIDFNLAASEPVLVADATIENDMAPTVVLTKSLNYFKTINPSLLAGSFVHNAEVYITENNRSQKLKEYAIIIAPGFATYFYSIDTANLAGSFLGEKGKTYGLKILSEGKEYISATIIPKTGTTLDSVWVKQAPFNPDSSKRVLYFKASDPPGLGNYIRYYTQKNGQVFLPGENSVFDDQVIDGTTFSSQLPQGIDRNDHPKPDSNFFTKGDTITLKFCNISQSTYKFWSTWEFAFQSIGNPFAQPNKVIGNVSNGALGAFSGYAAQYKMIVAP